MQQQNRLLNFYCLYVLYILVVHRSKQWWFVNNPPVSSRGQGSTLVTNDKNKKLKQKHKNKNSVIDMKKCQSELRAALDLPLWVTSEIYI